MIEFESAVNMEVSEIATSLVAGMLREMQEITPHQQLVPSQIEMIESAFSPMLINALYVAEQTGSTTKSVKTFIDDYRANKRAKRAFVSIVMNQNNEGAGTTYNKEEFIKLLQNSSFAIEPKYFDDFELNLVEGNETLEGWFDLHLTAVESVMIPA